jgi:hypothetical protein
VQIPESITIDKNVKADQDEDESVKGYALSLADFTRMFKEGKFSDVRIHAIFADEVVRLLLNTDD